MWNLLKGSGTVLLVVVVGIAFHERVYVPYRQNEAVKAGLYDRRAPAHELRRIQHLLEQHQPWDPYLQGWGALAEARILRKLGRSEAAREKYLEALEARLPHHYWVELGMYEWELGMNREAASHLRFAIEIHPGLLQIIRDDDLRRELPDVFVPKAD